ncbi:MAG: cysteine desulfurase [Clostridiaceae bacterium BRH_c20a]|nr:MAG: cysteine desulfurase [Clostridiaceae bacterium BRH_c20a]
MLYLDNSATTAVHPEVIKVMQDVLAKNFGNPSSLHRKGIEAEKMLQISRNFIAQTLQVKPHEIVFTSGGTEGDNLAVKGIALQYQNRGRHIIISQVEHPAVRESCHQLENLGFEITCLAVDKTGCVDPELVKTSIRNDTILVSIMQVNNEVGTIQPIQAIGDIIKKHTKIFFHVDGVQGYAKIPVQLKLWGVDLFTISAHKIHGPKGVGALYIREGIKLFPQITGGGQEGGIRSGTENIPGIVGFAKACQIAREIFVVKSEEMSNLRRECIVMLEESIPSIVINGPKDEEASPYIINLSIPGLKREVLVHALESEDIFVSTGSACSSKKDITSPVLDAMGIAKDLKLGSIRVSFTYDTAIEDIEVFVGKLAQVVEQLLRKN